MENSPSSAEKVAELVARLQARFGKKDGESDGEEAKALRYVIYVRKSTDTAEKDTVTFWVPGNVFSSLKSAKIRVFN